MRIINSWNSWCEESKATNYDIVVVVANKKQTKNGSGTGKCRLPEIPDELISENFCKN